jgi:hypothetical protein
MNLQLKSALILLENVFLENATFTRTTFKERLQNDEAGLKYSDTTISRLLIFIQDVFGISIRFNRYGTVEIVDQNDDDLSKYHFIKSLLLFGKIKENHRLINHHFSFSNENYFKNSELILDIYEAILKQNIIILAYQKFNSSEVKNHKIKPILFKEYLGRWYLIGKDDFENYIVLGVDRISSFEILNIKFESSLDAIQLYDHTIGVNYTGTLTHVVLWAEDYQMKLFESFPLHKSQKIIDRNDQGATFSLDVIINYEFKQLLASFLLKVKVLEPQDLKEEMKNIFLKMSEF